MTDEIDAAGAGWFDGLDPDAVENDAVEDAAAAIVEGRSDESADWPALAVDAGFADSEAEYYEALHEATVAAARAGVRERERADDQQLIHAVRAMDDRRRFLLQQIIDRISENDRVR